MAEFIQLDLFEDDLFFKDENYAKLNSKVSNIQRGLFKRHSIIEKKCSELQERDETFDCRLAFIESFLGIKQFNGTLNL